MQPYSTPCKRRSLSRTILCCIAPMLVIANLVGCSDGFEVIAFEATPVADAPASGRNIAQEKIDRIVENGAKSPVPPKTTVFTEEEANQLLRIQMKELMANGLSDPHLRLAGSDVLVARVVVDLDEYKRQRQGRGGLGPLALLAGRVPVTARGTLYARDGQGRIKLEAAELNGIPLPPALVREMITALSRSRRNPEGYDIEQPFALPANIRTVTINPKEAVVKQ
jgi:hypothetical protein